MVPVRVCVQLFVRELPLTLRIAAFWAGQEGTFLLWAALRVFGVLVIRASDEDEGVLMTVITVTQIFILFVLLVNSPFRYVWQQFPEQFSRQIFRITVPASTRCCRISGW